MISPFFPGTGWAGVQSAEKKHTAFIAHGEGSEVARVLARGFEDQGEFFAEARGYLQSERLQGDRKGKSTHVPERKRKTMTKAWGKRTFAP